MYQAIVVVAVCSILRDHSIADYQYWHSHKYEVESGMLILGTKQVVPSTCGPSRYLESKQKLIE